MILRAAFAVGGMAMGAEVLVGGVMIVAVDDDVAQELAILIGADCHAKYGSAPDNVVVDGQSYVLVLPPGLAALERFTNQEAQYGDVAAVPTPYM